MISQEVKCSYSYILYIYLYIDIDINYWYNTIITTLKGVVNMTAREIIQKRFKHEGTQTTPYIVSFEPELRKKLNDYYKCEDWEQNLLRKFTCNHLFVDTVGMKKLDDIYSKDAYGALWRMDRKPWHLDKPPLDEPEIGDYKFPTPESFVEPIFAKKAEAIKKYEADNEHYRVIAMGWGIFEHTWRLRGFENALMDTITDEDFYKDITEKLTDNYVAMLKACEDVPADAYLFGDDWGDQRGVIIGRDNWVKYIKPCWARIYDEVHRQGKIAIQHSCGSIVDIYDDLYEIGMDCHESVQPEAYGMAPEILREKYKGKISFWGCLGSQSTLNFGTPKEIEAEIIRLHNLFKDDGGYLLAPAKPLMDEMKVEQAVAVIETLAKLNS